jgi:hypothetical protein
MAAILNSTNKLHDYFSNVKVPSFIGKMSLMSLFGTLYLLSSSPLIIKGLLLAQLLSLSNMVESRKQRVSSVTPNFTVIMFRVI